MDNIVTFETAKRLKEAGFTQPKFKTGQFWYNEFMRLSFIGREEVSEADGHTYFFCVSVDSGRAEKIIPVSDDAYFAPTATDILREMPGAILVLENYGSQGKVWEVWKNGGLIADLENPAEAAAFAWLTLNEK